ncbi:MAG: 3-dehydroquinate synthase [Endomicrobium sp.]|jgi:3-dehydroquinate synthase|nr:3-dehydroquinate synthase [Endomicrobium sp.]
MKKLITVNLKNCRYKIVISQSEDDFFTALKKIARSNILFIITDKNVERLHLGRFASLLKQSGYSVKTAAISTGESGKNIKNLSLLYDAALKAGVDRDGCAIALGGGVVGDIAGFFAATYMRGIDFIQVPTTLLAMADSSIGGKTAANTTHGKNVAGVFYQPKFVWANSSFLRTLPAKHMKNGLAEIIKYAFVFDRKFYNYLFDLLKNNRTVPHQNFDYMIKKSCLYKVGVVEKDEKEITGLRTVLNFGHTFAHALETETKYKRFLHGEAVAIGMLFAAKLSFRLKMCEMGTYQKVENLLREAGFNLNISNDLEKLLLFMKKDKKTVNGNVKFVLIKDIGETVSCYVKDSIILSALKNFGKTNI